MGAGGLLGSTGGTLLTQHVLKQQGGLATHQEEDARQAFLQHANKKGDAFQRFTSAYEQTQPQRIYAEEEEEEEDDDADK
jgi:hypothetical protein